MSKKFQRTIEDFTCEKCGNFVQGTGYTNHCPKCLWCKHVDIFPGDRLNECQGLMKPTSIISEKGNFVLINTCEKCGTIKRNRTSTSDDLSVILKP